MSIANDAFSYIQDAIINQKIVDTHYHIGPEFVPRRYNIKTLAKAVKQVDATIVIKNHTYSTTPLASLARSEYEANIIGGIVLNHFSGGLSLESVRSALSGNKMDVTKPGISIDDPPFVVWMPTVHAKSHMEHFGYEFDPRWSGCCSHPAEKVTKKTNTQTMPEPVHIFDNSLRQVPELEPVLELMAEHRLVLATGHLSAPEIMKLVPLALEIGVASIILTHPHYPCVNLTNEQLRALTKSPKVFIEHCFAIHTIEKVPLKEFVNSINYTGPEQIICSTDFGQIFSNPFPDGSYRFAAELYDAFDNGISIDQFIQMFTNNGRRALNLL